MSYLGKSKEGLLNAKQWEAIAGAIKGEIANLEFQMNGWRIGSSPFRRLENEVRELEEILRLLKEAEHA